MMPRTKGPIDWNCLYLHIYVIYILFFQCMLRRNKSALSLCHLSWDHNRFQTASIGWGVSFLSFRLRNFSTWYGPPKVISSEPANIRFIHVTIMERLYIYTLSWALGSLLYWYFLLGLLKPRNFSCKLLGTKGDAPPNLFVNSFWKWICLFKLLGVICLSIYGVFHPL